MFYIFCFNHTNWITEQICEFAITYKDLFRNPAVEYIYVCHTQTCNFEQSYTQYLRFPPTFKVAFIL